MPSVARIFGELWCARIVPDFVGDLCANSAPDFVGGLADIVAKLDSQKIDMDKQTESRQRHLDYTPRAQIPIWSE